jgi:phospholipid/cholesterol/gamma-HCH transport system ATP-binding protein
MIEFRNLKKSFGDLVVLNGVDLVVNEGETLALLGPSGSGKSVLLKHAIGLLSPDDGDVIVDGVSIVNATAEELSHVRKHVGYVFQNSALFDSLSVAENLYLAQNDEGGKRSSGTCREEAKDPCPRESQARCAGQIPGRTVGRYAQTSRRGTRNASKPRYLLWDEPTTGLDPVNADNIDDLIMEVSDKLGVTSIVVTHDLDTAFEVGDRIALLYDGKVRASATPAEILQSEDPVVRRFVRRSRIDAAVA